MMDTNEHEELDEIALTDILNHHTFCQEPLTEEQVNLICEKLHFSKDHFEERLPGEFWHCSFPRFPKET